MRIESQEYLENIQQLKQYCASQLSSMSEIRNGLQIFIKELSENFTGETGKTINLFLSEVIKPLLEKVENTFEEFKEAVEKIEHDINTNFGYDGIIEDDYVQTDYIKSTRQYTEELLDNIDMTNNVIRSIDWILPLSQISKTDIEYDFNALEKEVNKTVELREEYDRKWLNELKDVKQSIDEIKRMLSVLDNNSISPSSYQSGDIFKLSDGILFFSLSIVMTDEDFLKYMKEKFGFDDETIRLMLMVRTGIDEKFPNITQREKDWLFNRLLGGFVYGNAGGNSNEDYEFRWNSTAGNIKKLFKKNGLFAGAMSYVEIFEYLGLSKDEYRYLRYKVRIQYFISSNPDEYRYDKIPIEKYDVFKKTMAEALGIPIDEFTDEMFELKWTEQWNGMHDKGDFAHMTIIVSTHLADNAQSLASWGVGGKSVLEDKGSWYGDLTTVDKETGLASAGPDDYKADLDAENIIYLMKSNEWTYDEAFSNYYKGLENGAYNRAELFTTYTESYDSVEKRVLKKFNFSNLEELKVKQPDVYNFLLSLKNGENEMRVY